ncbi:MAG: hypothetical protein AB7K09_10260 [Planctomycetota bacterium]
MLHATHWQIVVAEMGSFRSIAHRVYYSAGAPAVQLQNSPRRNLEAATLRPGVVQASSLPLVVQASSLLLVVQASSLLLVVQASSLPLVVQASSLLLVVQASSLLLVVPAPACLLWCRLPLPTHSKNWLQPGDRPTASPGYRELCRTIRRK